MLLVGARDVRVVRRLAHVAVIVGVDGLLGAELAAERLDGLVGDDLESARRQVGEPGQSAMDARRESLSRSRPTSLTFMLVCVPEPVWKTTSGKWSMSLPEMTWQREGGYGRSVEMPVLYPRRGRVAAAHVVSGGLNGLRDFGVQACKGKRAAVSAAGASFDRAFGRATHRRAC